MFHILKGRAGRLGSQAHKGEEGGHTLSMSPVHGLPAETHLKFFREGKMAEKELRFSFGKQYL